MFGKLIKVALAVTVSALVLSTTGCKNNTPATPPEPKLTQGVGSNETRVVEIKVTEKGYEPSPITLKKDQPVKLVVTRTTEETCANEVVLDEYNINTALPLNQPVEIAFTPNKSGELKYGCAMDKMISGVFKVE